MKLRQRDGFRFTANSPAAHTFTNLIGQQTETAQVAWDVTLPGYGMTDLLLFGREGKAMRG